MRKGREIIGLPVIGLPSGKEIGVVDDIIWSHQEQKITHLVVAGKGVFNRCRYISFEEIKSIGDDAVTVDEEIWKESPLSIDGKRVSQIAGDLVLTEDGQNIGTLEDLFFNGATGKLLGYEVSTGLVGDLLSGRMTMPPEKVLTWGEEAIIADYNSLDRGEDDAVPNLPEQPDR